MLLYSALVILFCLLVTAAALAACRVASDSDDSREAYARSQGIDDYWRGE